MSISALKKLTFCGVLGDKQQVLADLQTLGKVHLINTQKAGVGSAQLTPPIVAEQANKALKFLRQCPRRRHQQTSGEKFNFDRVVKRALAIQFDLRQLADKRDALIKRIKEVTPWGNFNLPADQQLAGIKLWFYILPKRLMKKMRDVDLVWQVVFQDNLYDYVVVIADEEPAASVMPVARTHTGTHSLATLNQDLDKVELVLEDLQAERESLTRWIALIAANLGLALDQSELDYAQASTLESDGVFIVQAWCDVADLHELASFAANHQLALISADPEPAEIPPTLLKNTAYWAGGQDLVGFYQTPGYFGWDPSPVVFYSFALFFAMIMSDAGYAALFGLILSLRWRAMGKTLSGIRLRMLALVIIALSLFWGVLANGYFGYSFAKQTWLGQLGIIDMQNFDAMMRLSVFVGVMHIALANAIMTYQRWGKTTALASLGWFLLVLGGFSAWIATVIPQLPLRQIGFGMVITGALGVLLFTSEQAVAKPIDVLWRFLEGLKALVEITGLFGNVLSYLRLFALGMASVSLAVTFNQLAAEVYHAMPGAGVLLSLLILLVGHTLNLLLCLLSGVVHGLRLNFIEFYNWSVSDEGYPFKAFASRRADK
ncbi:MAG: V-type ATPase 116kDa subunit family protein [Methylococcaceae bacterium]|jgi:V/A-type H+-transporting ATPase subunit I